MTCQHIRIHPLPKNRRFAFQNNAKLPKKSVNQGNHSVSPFRRCLEFVRFCFNKPKNQKSVVMVCFLKCSENTVCFSSRVLGTQIGKNDRQCRHAFQAMTIVILCLVKFHILFSPQDISNHFFGIVP